MLRLIVLFFRALMLCLVGGEAHAQGSISQFADFNTGPNDNPVGSLGAAAVFFDTRTFFVVTTREAGAELWVTDGSALNTRLFADICPGRCSSIPSAFYVEGSNLFFAADDGRRGVELWRLAAGAAAPVLVADINPGAPGSSPSRFERLGFAVSGTAVTRTFFVATRPAEGREIWRLNAGATPTVALELDLVPGSVSSRVGAITTFNTLQIGVTARTPNVGTEVYALNYGSTTAAATGATLLTGFATNSQRTAYEELFSLGPNTYLRILDRTVNQDELWVTQGTAASTIKLRTAADITEPTINTALFRLFFGSGSGAAKLLAVTDGSVAGTTDLTSTTVNPGSLVSVGGQVVFTGLVGVGNGRELFRSNGTVAGTVFLKELVAGSASIPTNAVFAASANNSRMMLGFDDRLWISDATSAGTIEISGTAIEGPGRVFLLLPTTATSALIGFQPDGSGGSEPFFTQGTIGSTVALGNFVGDVGDSFPSPLATISNRLLFAAFIPGLTGNEFGMPLSGVGIPEDLGNYTPTASGEHFGRVWFRGGSGLVQTDGTTAGTSEISSVRPEIRGPECVIERNGAAYFLGVGADFSDVEVYRSDGSAANTVPVTDFSTGVVRAIQDFCFSGFHSIAAFADKLFFIGDQQSGFGSELYVLNAADQPSLVADIRAGSNGSNLRDLVALDDRIVFAADDGIFGRELWVSTGTAQGTQRLADINPGVAASDPADLTRVGALVYFTAFDPASGRELYVTDGTVAGTRRVRDLFSGVGSAFSDSVRFAIAFGNRIFFPAISTAEPACVLFESDGSLAGTRCAYDSAAISLGPVQDTVVSDSGALVFAAKRFVPDDGEEVRVLFNRQLLDVAGYDIRPGSAGSAPEELMVSGDSVFFRASDGITGSELWRLDLPDLDALFSSGFE